MKIKENFLESCLFYNTNALSRNLLKMAEIEFSHLNLSPAHASLLLFVYDNPGITPKQLSGLMCLTPSTITRFLNALIKKGLLRRKAKGKSALISATTKGLEVKRPIALAYKKMVENYTQILGKYTVAGLLGDIHDVNEKLKIHFTTHDNEL